MSRNPFRDINYRAARRVVVAVVGGTVLLIGMAMIVLPGPALVVIPAGLGIMAMEFAWARRWLRKVKKQIIPRLQTGEDTKGNGRKEPDQKSERAHDK